MKIELSGNVINVKNEQNWAKPGALRDSRVNVYCLRIVTFNTSPCDSVCKIRG